MDRAPYQARPMSAPANNPASVAVSPAPGEPVLTVLCNDEPLDGRNLLQRGLEEALIRAGVPAIRRQRYKLGRKLGNACSRFGITRRLKKKPKRAIVAGLAWASDMLAFPEAMWCELTPWIFDCWGPQFSKWEALLRRHRVRDAFFSARAAAQHFAKTMPGLRAHWLPEAVDPQRLDASKSLLERQTHVLEMGRGFRDLHEAITGLLAKRGVRHRYQAPGAPFIFNGLDDLYRGLGDTAIMICYPKSMTHPDNAGGVETVTQRYFESIGSRCLIVGHCPAELRDLFGFDPVIALPGGHEAERLLDIIANLGSYQAQVDRAHARLLEVGTFDARARTLLDTWTAVRSRKSPA